MPDGHLAKAAHSSKIFDSGLQVTPRGEPRGNLANAMHALRTRPSLSVLLKRDEMLRATMLCGKIPNAPSGDAHEDYPRVARQEDIAALLEHLQQTGLPTLRTDVVQQAVELRAYERPFHPVREYLQGLEWDDKPRLDHWLTAYLGADDTSYSRAIGAMFLIGMIARIFEPGCQMDYALVLEGEQGDRKSSACAILGGQHYSDALPDIRNGKDASEHLNGRWVIEIPELSAIKGTESARLKAFITRRVERYRRSYGRGEVHEPRQCVFVATTNELAYMRDETGGRRFWPIRVGKIDLVTLVRDRDQIFAEALVRYRSGGRWWPDERFEAQHIKPEQEARFEEDAWEPEINQYLAGKDQVFVAEIARHVLRIDTAKVDPACQDRINKVLARADWQRGKKGNRGRPWVRRR